MGIDLTLLDIPESGVLRNKLRCNRRSTLFAEIRHLPRSGVIHPSCLIQIDGYGSRITTVTVEQLLELSDRREIADDFENRAIWAYLRELPPTTKIGLLWT